MHFKKFLFCTLCLVNTSLYANVIDISPTRIEMNSDQNIKSFQVRNNSNKKIVFQATVKKWSQKKEKDIYTNTRDIIATPPIFTLYPKQKQIIRISKSFKKSLKTEQAYRLYLKQLELPKKNNFHGLRFIFNISIPIFIIPDTIQKNLVWNTKKIKNNQIKLTVENKSNTHIQFKKLTLLNENHKILFDKSIFFYVLPNQDKTWTLNTRKLTNFKKLKLIADTDFGKEQFDVK